MTRSNTTSVLAGVAVVLALGAFYFLWEQKQSAHIYRDKWEEIEKSEEFEVATSAAIRLDCEGSHLLQKFLLRTSHKLECFSFIWENGLDVERTLPLERVRFVIDKKYSGVNVAVSGIEAVVYVPALTTPRLTWDKVPSNEWEPIRDLLNVRKDD